MSGVLIGLTLFLFSSGKTCVIQDRKALTEMTIEVLEKSVPAKKASKEAGQKRPYMISKSTTKAAELSCGVSTRSDPKWINST